MDNERSKIEVGNLEKAVHDVNSILMCKVINIVMFREKNTDIFSDYPKVGSDILD